MESFFNQIALDFRVPELKTSSNTLIPSCTYPESTPEKRRRNRVSNGRVLHPKYRFIHLYF